MSWLSDLLGKTIKTISETFPDRKILTFKGAGVTVVDNPETGSTDVTISGGGGGGGGTIIYRAGVTSEGSVYGTWDEAHAAWVTSGEAGTIFIDTTYAGASIPNGSYDGEGLTLEGLGCDPSTVARHILTFEDGASLFGSFTVRNLHLLQASDAAAPSIECSGLYNRITLDSVIVQSLSAVPLINGSAGGNVLILVCENNTELTSGGLGITSGESGLIDLYALGNTLIANDAVYGDSGTVAVHVGAIVSTVANAQVSYSGTYTVTPIASAPAPFSMGGNAITDLDNAVNPADALPLAQAQALFAPFALTIGFNAAGYRTVSGDITIDSDDSVLAVSTSGAARNITLPAASLGRAFLIKKTTTDANKITLVRAASESIEGVAANYDLLGSTFSNRPSWEVWCDGTDWFVS